MTAVKPYGAFIDVGGISGLLHISQISCDHIADVSSVLPQGSEIKCMVISQDKGKGRIALSTKTLEAEPGDMIKDREKVFANAEDTAAKYQERLEAERKAREEAEAAAGAEEEARKVRYRSGWFGLVGVGPRRAARRALGLVRWGVGALCEACEFAAR